MLKFNYRVLLCVSIVHLAVSQDFGLIRRMRECFTQDYAVVCLKERALDAINETIFSDKPMSVYGLVNIVKDPNFRPSATTNQDNLPADVNERNQKLNEILYDKVEEFVESRSMKINLSDVFEGRAKGGKGGKKGGMLMMGGLAMMGMLAQMFMGKIAFMAGAALLVAKMALMLSTIIGLKKLSGGGGGGGGESHIVYTSSSDGGGYGHGGGGGGGGSWHRSLNADAQNIAYRGYAPDDGYVQ